jgi:hypothetical protein
MILNWIYVTITGIRWKSPLEFEIWGKTLFLYRSGSLEITTHTSFFEERYGPFLTGILSSVGVTIDRVLNWILDLLTTYRSWVPITITRSLISTLYKWLHAESSPACSVFTGRFLVTNFNSGDSSCSRVQVLTPQTPVQNSLGRPKSSFL